MNIMLQTAGFFVMSVIFLFYFVDRQGAVRSNRLFLYQGIAIFISIFLDIFSIVLINTPSINQSLFTITICKLYLVSCTVVVYLGLVYVLGDVLYQDKNKFKIFSLIGFLVFLLGAVLIFTQKIEVVYDPDGLNDYTEGSPIIATYIVNFIFIISMIFITIVKRNQMYKKRVIGVLIFLSLWIFGSLVQGLFNYILKDLGITVLAVSFAESLGSLVIYIMLENPSLNIDKVTNALNQRALAEYIEYCFDKNKNIEFLMIDYDNTVASSLMGYNSFSLAMTKLLNDFKSGKIFKDDKNNFVIIRNKENDDILLNNVSRFKEEFYKRNNISMEIPMKILYFNDITLFNNAVDVLNSVNYIDSINSSFEHDIIEITLEMVEKIHKKFIMDQKCDNAFSKKRVVVYFQPIFSNNDLTFTSAEALVRLKDDDGKLIFPGDFIETMESDGRIVELGKMVFEEVCRFISENDMEKLGLHYIEVNLSTVQCMQDDLATSYIAIMEKYKINPKYINLEITETGSLARNTLLKNMEILKEYGVSFSLDDFGTGNSNLNYIVDMPVDIVKFDKQMVTSYFENKIASYVMDSTIEMIKGLGHKIVFEGVEKEEQIVSIKTLKVDYIQGYYYSKPVDKESFVMFLNKNNN